MKKNKRGFTLFELLVSISIIGILTAIASVSFSSAQKKARDARRMEDMASVAKAAESFYAVNSASYPINNTTPWVATGIGDTILAIFPTDPKGVGWTAYVYGGGTTFYACAAVENRGNGKYTDNRGTTVGAGGTGPYYCVKNQQ